jgi:hypothetical protein
MPGPGVSLLLVPPGAENELLTDSAAVTHWVWYVT